MNKIKKLFKNRIFLCLFTALLVGSITVKAATYFPSNDVIYDNSESGLKSADVQGAIDELYNKCFPPGPLDGTIFEDKVVTSGDGLYKDEYDDGRYFYKGANPNNYVTFNNEEAGWRIVSIEPDMTIKIMRIASIGEQYWDTIGNNNWARPASLNTYLNGTYYNGLNATAKSQIVAKDWSIGAVTNDNNNMANTISNENYKKWNGKVALVTVSEYIRSNSNKSNCGSFSLNNNNYSSCKNTTWMYINDYWWILTPCAGDSYHTFRVYSNGRVDYYGNDDYAVRPSLFLSSEVQITGGTGTQNNPYIIE